MVYHDFPWSHGQDIKDSIDGALDTISSTTHSGQCILVHCQQGVSRSAALVIAYVMKSKSIPFSEAYALVKSRSPIISPNMVLVSQLVELEMKWKQ